MAHDCTISRRSFVAGTSALAGLAAVAGATKPSFGIADDATPYEEGVTEVWGHCAINCPGRCALKFHVKDGEVLWVDTYSNPTNDLDDPQPRACLRGRSYRRWMNNPDRINYPMKRVEADHRREAPLRHRHLRQRGRLQQLRHRRVGHHGPSHQPPHEPARRPPQLLRQLLHR